MSVVEPVFGNIGTNKRLNRFSLRGPKKVQGQWRLYCLVHNIEKLANYRGKFDYHGRQRRRQNLQKCDFLSAISKENS